MPRPEGEVKIGPTAHQPGLELTEYLFPNVPLDHNDPNGPVISVFAREVVSTANAPIKNTLPWLLYLQGGPGFASPRPMGKRGWIGHAVKNFRILLLDQRGTGRSTPLTVQTLRPFTSTPRSLARYLMRFRADSIVKDCEWIRRALEAQTTHDIKWTVLGQSYGGFVLLSYLSMHPEGLGAALFTGGLPPLRPRSVDDVYRNLYPRLIEHNKWYYDRYPSDIHRVQTIVNHLDSHIVEMPSSGQLTSRRFRQLGLTLGMNGGADALHYMIEDAWVVPEGASAPVLNERFLQAVESAQPFSSNPLYALLHEAIYCEGKMKPSWSAHRVLDEFPEMTNTTATNSDPFMFTGEMIYPHMFEDYTPLTSLYETACVLAENDEWPVLYDLDALRQNTVPCAAVVFKNDMYVDCDCSVETGRLINAHVWVTHDYSHSALREDGERILSRLLDMVDAANGSSGNGAVKRSENRAVRDGRVTTTTTC